jgi:hypothetical protein
MTTHKCDWPRVSGNDRATLHRRLGFLLRSRGHVVSAGPVPALPQA